MKYQVLKHEVREMNISQIRKENYSPYNYDPSVAFESSKLEDAQDYFNKQNIYINKYYNQTIKKEVMDFDFYEFIKIDDDETIITIACNIPTKDELEDFWDNN